MSKSASPSETSSSEEDSSSEDESDDDEEAKIPVIDISTVSFLEFLFLFLFLFAHEPVDICLFVVSVSGSRRLRENMHRP